MLKKFLLLHRQKVDLTKYIEEHDFNFDNCFDSDADNQRVSYKPDKFFKSLLPSKYFVNKNGVMRDLTTNFLN